MKHNQDPGPRSSKKERASRALLAASALGLAGVLIIRGGRVPKEAAPIRGQLNPVESHNKITTSLDKTWIQLADNVQSFAQKTGNGTKGVIVRSNIKAELPNNGPKAHVIDIESKVFNASTQTDDIYAIETLTPDNYRKGAEVQPNSTFQIIYYQVKAKDNGPITPSELASNKGNFVYSFELNKDNTGDWQVTANYGNNPVPYQFSSNPNGQQVLPISGNEQYVNDMITQAGAVLNAAEQQLQVSQNFPEVPPRIVNDTV